MKNKKRIVAVPLVLCVVVAFAYLQRGLVRCEFVGQSDLREVEKGLYLDPALGPEQTAQFQGMVAAARRRDAAIFGELRSIPAILAGPGNRVMDRFGEPGNRTAVTRLFLGQAFIVLGVDGLNLDVSAHELMHAELYKRVGGWNRELKIPTWFDEGLAMQADNRESFSEAQWQARTKGGSLAPDLRPLTSGRKFFAGDVWANFATAKHEVRRWLGVVGTPGLLDFIARLNNHESFASAYQGTEDKFHAGEVRAR